jgi:hypothetical protein
MKNIHRLALIATTLSALPAFSADPKTTGLISFSANLADVVLAHVEGEEGLIYW